MGSALTMEPGTLVQQQQQLPLHNDYSLSSNADALDQFPGHAHHSSYTTNGAVEPLRRDISLVQQSTGAFAYATSGNTAGPRYVPSRNVAPDGRSYPATQNLTDSGSGSISTSPSSAASSLAYNNYQQANHYTGSVVPSYPGTVPLAQPFVPQSYTGARAPSILDGSTQSVLSPSTRSPLSGATNATDRDVYTNASPYLARNALSPSVQSSYPHYADPSRSILTAAAAGLSLTGVPSSGSTHMATPGAHAYGGMQNESLNFPWPNLEVLLELHCGDMPVTPEVHAKVEKGFFLSTVDDKWTCYRRNYFSVNCHFELHPNVSNGRLTIKRNNHTEQVMAMGMRLSAAVDGSQGKSIELVQHTPKRDAGPKNKIDVTKVSPTPTGRLDSTISPHGVYQIPMHTFHATGHHPGPILPFQSKPDDTSLQQPDSTPTMSQFNMNSSGSAHIPLPGSSTTHTFERIQFKQATANNGKRRASQQYFHLVVELFVDIRKGENDVPSWVKIAQRVSEKIVVRGRSPSHYQNEGQNGTTGRGGSTGSNGGYSTGGASFGAMNAGGFRGAGSHYSGGNGGVNGYRANHYGLGIPLGDPGSHSGSSSSSIDGGPVDGYPVDTVMSDADRIALHEHSGYQYYPSTIYEGMPTQLPPLGKIESNARFSTEPRQYAVKTEYSDAIPGAQYSASGIGRFQGVDSSRGYYPDLQTGCH